MATDEEEKEVLIPVKKQVLKPIKKEESFTLLKDFLTAEKHYKKGEQYSHSNKKVIEYLRTNKFI